MLEKSLKFRQRGKHFYTSHLEASLFTQHMEKLHEADVHVKQYFGLARAQLLECINGGEEGFTLAEGEAVAVEALNKKIIKLEAQTFFDEASVSMGLKEFGLRFYNFFVKSIVKDVRFSAVTSYIDVDKLLGSTELYIVDVVSRSAEPSLVHYLNTRISEGEGVGDEQLGLELRYKTLRPLLTAYPVLAKGLFEFIDDTVDYFFKVLQGFIDDKEHLALSFKLKSQVVSSICFGLGDPHGNSETVCSVEVGDTVLIYKPRKSHEVVFYNRLLAFLCSKTRLQCFDIYAPVLLNIDNHSWIERVENRVCETEADVALFYQKLGAQVAVIYALNGIDFHHENIIACGCDPVMIDLECLFTGSLSDQLFDLPRDSALFKAFKQTRHSVFSSGFVPFAQGGSNDVSGLSRQEILLSTSRKLVCESGFYHLIKHPVEHRSLQKHLPIFENTHRGVDEWRDAFMNGFECGYDAVMNNRDEVVSLLEESAANLSTRVLVRNTQRYADFMSLSQHPRFTQNMLDKELLLATIWKDTKPHYADVRVPEHEIAALEKRCVPYFTMKLDTCRLVSSHGIVSDMQAVETPLDCCKNKIASLSPVDKRLQMAVLQNCLFSDPDSHLSNGKASRDALSVQEQVQRLECVVTLASLLEELAIGREGSDVRWLNFQTNASTRRKYLSPMGNGLYSGIAGLGLLYLGLYKVTQQAFYLQRVDQILQSLSETLDYFKADISVSAYHGVGSYLYLRINRQVIVDEPLFDTIAEGWLSKLMEVPACEYEYDFLGGCCGAITLLSNIYLIEPRADLLLAINRWIEYLRSETVFRDGKCYRKKDSSIILTGLSHGLSGVTYAICKAYEVNEDESLISLAIELIKAENCLMKDGFWLDLRDADNPGCLSMWCHGDGGILLTRQQFLKTMENKVCADILHEVQSDIVRCEHNLWEKGFGSSYSLCHGDFGNLMCLHTLYQRTANQPGLDRVEQHLSLLTDRFFAGATLNTQSLPDIGLMTGVAGVGYALLYAIDPTMPGVLTLGLGSV